MAMINLPPMSGLNDELAKQFDLEMKLGPDEQMAASKVHKNIAIALQKNGDHETALLRFSLGLALGNVSCMCIVADLFTDGIGCDVHLATANHLWKSVAWNYMGKCDELEEQLEKYKYVIN